MTRASVLALALLGARCTEWVPATAPSATGERYVRVHLADETRTLRAPSRGTLRELEHDGARLEVRKVDEASTVLATLGIMIGAAAMTAFVVYAVTRTPFVFGNVP